MFRRILAGAAIAAAALGFSATAASADIGPNETGAQLAAINLPVEVGDWLNNALSQAELLSRNSLVFNAPILNGSPIAPLFSTVAIPRS
ncbi:hypothetical protein [Nonomuraea basaltis]|uniref:hypothetical protein n=1 Tax=Nonomuraea basaltis TaxID=2495887 RepID=UPI00110C563A|nr:hypothetical protein [Nonomuraea basaltis]TMR98747.1 hypothetical protein EJK15_11470 [Nonomuraea basaltis]